MLVNRWNIFKIFNNMGKAHNVIVNFKREETKLHVEYNLNLEKKKVFKKHWKER